MAEPLSRLSAALSERYRIERRLGEGGMATVYLADDVRHSRKVAVKVLKPELAAAVGSERFLAEIRTTANLQHPNILPLFDSGAADGFLYYVMPFVEGESLRDRLDREGQLPVDDALAIAVDVAEALEYAHSRGVIHRDVKPANILLHAGKPMIADFGIALAVGAASGGRLTATGLSLGTPQYMSPEQATGNARIGPATDLWALGCVLYEMLVGEAPYAASTPQAILAKVIAAEPASALERRRSVPEHVDGAIRRALEKLPADRFTTVADFRRALEEPIRARRTGGRSRPASGRGTKWLPLAETAAVLAAAMIGVWIGRWSMHGPSARAPVVQFEVQLPPGDRLSSGTGAPGSLAISPDGTRIVFSVRSGGVDRLYTRLLDGLEVTEIKGTEGGQGPFFSPDGKSVGFFADGRLKRIDLLGGAATAVAEVRNPLSGSWGDDGRIAYTTWDGPVMVVPAEGGTPEALSTDTAFTPHMLPGGRGVLYAAGGRIHLLDFATGASQTITDGDTPSFTTDGHLVFARGRTLVAASFDPKSLRLGEPVVLVEGVRRVQAWTIVAVSRIGTFVYAPPEPARTGQLGWVDRQGGWEAITEAARTIQHPRLSPDGRFVTFTTGARQVIVRDLRRGSEGEDAVAEGSRPVWMSDSRRIVFASGGGQTLQATSVDGGKAQLIRQASPAPLFPLDWSADGTTLAYSVADPTTSRDVWTVETGGEPKPFLATMADERAAAFSPDRRWMTFAILETGRPERVYIDRFPEGGHRVLVSSAAAEPRWSPAGDEIFYRSLDGRELWSVPVDMKSGELGTPRRLIEGPYQRTGTGFFASYDVSRDGRRFLMIRENESQAPEVVHVVVNGVRGAERVETPK